MRSFLTTLGLSAALFLLADAASLTRVPHLAHQVALGAEQYQVPRTSPAPSPPSAARLAEAVEAIQAIVPDPEPEPTLAIASYTHRVRARGYVLADVNGQRKWIEPSSFPTCTAVSLGRGKFVTAGHLTNGLGGKIEVDVEVEGRWVNNAAQTRVAGRDLLYLAIDREVPGVEVRAPEHYEDVTLYGLTSGEPQTGIFAGDNHLALTPDEPGITFGDSGGGVFGIDGRLIGIIQGFGRTGERSVYMVRLDDVAAPQPVAAVPANPPTNIRPPAKAVPPVSACPNGQCPRAGISTWPTFNPRGRRR